MKSGMRVLYVLPYTPSPIRVRPYQIIRALARAGHAVTVVTLEDGFTSDAALQELKSICEGVHIVRHPRWRAAANCLLSLPTPTPLWAAYCRSVVMQRLLMQLVQENRFDIAHVEHLRAAHFASALGSLPKVLDAVDCITSLRRQILDQAGFGVGKLVSYEEWRKLRGYEPRIYRPYAEIAVTTAHDASELMALTPQALPPITVIPNGVDLDYFHPVDAEPPERNTITFSGKMSYIANEDAACFLLKDILPLLRRRRPGVKVNLVGSNPTAALRELAQKTGEVTVTGYVEDLRPFIRRAAVAVCPMRIGVGIQNKALEAMALGRPVVATPLAGRALTGAVATGAVRLAETADAFADACAGLLDDTAAATQMGQEARRYTEANHRWDHVAEQFVELYERARRR